MRFHLRIGFGAFLIIFASMFLSTAHVYGVESTDGSFARDVLTKEVKKMFLDRKFAQLDEMADGFRATKARFKDGQWKLQVFFTSFNLGTRAPEWVFPTYISLAEEWRHSRPQSVTAQCVLAGIWTDYAWKARGGGYASEVKDEAWPLIRERLDKAWVILNEPPKPGVLDCPRRHNLRLSLAKARGVEKDEFEVLFKEAVRQAPGYYHHYVVKADYLLPKWYGEEGEWQRFIADIADENPGDEGATIYTRSAWSMFQGNDWQDFKGSGISWDKMKKGFKEIDRNYPNSQWILNWYARFACRAGDLETMNDLLKRIDTRNYNPEAWEKDSIEDCRSLAKLGKSKDEVEKEKMAEHMRQFEVKVFQNILGLAEKGNSKVIGDLAEMYLKGRGTTSDPVAAYAWFLQDENTYKEQLEINSKILTSEQLSQAKDRAAIIRSKISQQTK